MITSLSLAGKDYEILADAITGSLTMRRACEGGGIRSAASLRNPINLNSAQRWFSGYDLDEPVPYHSSLRKIREGYVLEVCQQFCEHILERRIKAGLVWGEELYLTTTKYGTIN